MAKLLPNTIVPETDKAKFVSHSYTQGHRVAPRLHSSIKMAVIRILTEQLRYSIRGLRNSPGFTISALVILALGIGANTAIFSVVNAVLLKPLPFPESESIVMIFHVPPAQSFPGVSIFRYRQQITWIGEMKRTYSNPWRRSAGAIFVWRR